MTSQTQGIQKLLAAERKAAEKLNEARARKAQRLKQAREDAQAEIKKFREEEENRFQRKKQEYLGTHGDMEATIEQEAAAKIKEMNKSMSLHKEEVLEHLLALVCDIKPQLHPNIRIMG